MTHQYSRAERLLTRPFHSSTDEEDASKPLANGHALPHTTPFSAFPGPSMPGGSSGQGGLLDKGKGKETFYFLALDGQSGSLPRHWCQWGRTWKIAYGFRSTGHGRRAVRGHCETVDVSVACRYLAAQCQVRQGRWAEAMEMLGEINPFRETSACCVLLCFWLTKPPR